MAEDDRTRRWQRLDYDTASDTIQVLRISIAEVRNAPRDPDVWLPLGLDPFRDRIYARGANALGVIGRLEPGVTADAAQRELTAIADQLETEQPGFNRGVTLELVSLRDQATAGVREMHEIGEVAGVRRGALREPDRRVGLPMRDGVADPLRKRQLFPPLEAVKRAMCRAGKPGLPTFRQRLPIAAVPIATCGDETPTT